MEDQAFREQTSHEHSMQENSTNQSTQNAVKTKLSLVGEIMNKASPVVHSQIDTGATDGTIFRDEPKVGRCDIC